MKFKELREKVKAKSIRAEDGEEQKLADLASDESQLDDASAQNRNPDGTAEDQVDKSIKPIYKKTENGMYTLANEEVDQVDEAVDAAKLLSKKDVAVYGKKMSKVLRLTGEGNINGAMKINATLPKNVRKVLTHVSNENELKSVLSGVKEEVEFDITENTIDDIKKLTSLSQSGTVRFADGSSAKVSPQVATALLQTHGNLNTNNQTKFAKKLASSAKEFAKLEKFALQQIQISGRLHQLNNL